MNRMNGLNGSEQREPLTPLSRPSRNGKIFYVEKVAPGHEESFVLAAKNLHGFYTHYNGRRSVPCWKNHDLCDGGHKEGTLRENFVVQAWSLKRSKYVFLYLTPGCATQLEDQTQGADTYVGLPVIVTKSAAKTGPLTIRVASFTSVQKLTAKELDPYDSIMRFLKVDPDVADQRRSLAGIPRAAQIDAADLGRLKAAAGALSFKSVGECSGEDLRLTTKDEDEDEELRSSSSAP